MAKSKIDRAMEANERVLKKHDKLFMKLRIAELEEREAKLVAALRFYAGPTLWRKVVVKDDYYEGTGWEARFSARNDHGELAQSVLAELGLAEEGT